MLTLMPVLGGGFGASVKRTQLAILVSTIAFAACEQADRSGVAVTDSAGITLVTSVPADSLDRVNFEVEFSIGEAEGERHLLFGNIADIEVDPRGTLLVLDQQAGEVRVFDSRGRHVRSVGRPGRGPGEVSRWANAVLTDTAGNIYVADAAQGRITVFDSAGSVRSSEPVPTQPAGQSWVRLEDGGYMFRGLAVSRGANGAFAFWNGLLRTRAVQQGQATELDTVLVFSYPVTEIGAPPDLRVPLVVNVPFWTRLADGRIAWSSLDRSEILVHSADGDLQSILRSPSWRRRPTSTSDVTVLRNRLRDRLASLGGDVSAADGPNVDAPDSLPAITALLSAPDGGLWVQRMGSVEEVDPSAVNSSAGRTSWLGGTSWDVLDSRGAFQARAIFPAGVRPLRVTHDGAVGVATDGMGVQRVVWLRPR